MSKDKQSELKDRGGYIAGVVNGARGKGCVTERTAITLDLDEGDIFTLENVKTKCHYKYYLHSTRKHSKENPRYRLIIPLTKPVQAKHYELLARTLAQDIGVIEAADPTTYQAERLMYFPTISCDAKDNFVYEESNFEFLNPDTLLSRYANIDDMSCYPRAIKETSIVKKQLSEYQNTDPLTKPGWIGAFNRAYPIKEAIEKFLNSIYEPTPNSTDRYSYTEAESTGGLVIYDNTAYSHHATDPASGQLCNAFDLVRIHLYGDEDIGIDTLNTHIMDLPSMQAMIKLCMNDSKVKQELTPLDKNVWQLGCEKDLEDVPVVSNLTTQNNKEWQSDLSYSKNGRLENSVSNFAQILRNDPRLQGIAYNEMNGKICLTNKLPWRNTAGAWTDADSSQLNVFLDESYHIYSPVKVKDALLTVAFERKFHPLKFWLNSLDDWDKVPRIETLLVDYLGAEDTPYTRAVTRKTLIAAVARIFEPAIKFDNVLVLVGGQGIGKSTFFKKLAKQYFTDCLTLNDMKDKTAAEKISGYWIVEISELGGSRTADRELVKAFISRQDDTYRAAYGTTTESHPRQCIIVGTTNAEDGCLYDTTGNRRFFPVNVKGSTQKHTWDLSDETINQIWAEAKHYYDNGETLTMPKELTEAIKEQQQNMLVTDDRGGIVKEWLEEHNYTQISKIELWCKFFGGTKETYDMKAQKQMKNIKIYN